MRRPFLAFVLLVPVITAGAATAQQALPSNPAPDKVVTSFTWNYDFQPEPGKRTWTRKADGSWSEQYPSGRVAKVFDVSARGTVDRCAGAIVSPSGERSFEVFIPDVGCKPMVAKFRHGSGAWSNMGEMKTIKTAAAGAGSKPPLPAAPPPAPVAAAVPATAPSPSPVPALPAASSETRIALVIGNVDYTVRRLSGLANPLRDAEAVAATLRKVGFSEVVEAKNLSLKGMLDALKAFSAKAANADWAMVYYAGHGVEADGINYLIPTDAQVDEADMLKREAVSLNDVLKFLAPARKLRLVLLDACRDDPFSRSAGGRGLSPIEPGRGELVVYAAKAGQMAADGNGTNSPFATALVKHMAEPGIEIDKMFRRVADDVMEATGSKRQQPYTYGSLSGRESYYFVAPK